MEIFEVPTIWHKLAIMFVGMVATFCFVVFGLSAVPWNLEITISYHSFLGWWAIALILWIVWTVFLFAAKIGHPIITIERTK